MARLVFFSADDGVHGDELWVTDGTSAGTRMVRDINTNNNTVDAFRGSNPQDIEDLGDGRVIFRARDSIFGGRDELWVSDGTAAGTGLVRNIGGSTNSEPGAMTQVSPGLAVFHADDGVHGRELWATDGTYAGTVLIADINPGAASAFDRIRFENFTRIEENFVSLGFGRVVFSADDGVHGREVWVTDGTPAGTHMLKDILPGSGSGVATGVDVIVSLDNGRAIFAADDGVNGKELWVTDGTTNGTVLLRDLAAGASDANPRGFQPLPNGQVEGFYSGGIYDGRVATDGTLAGTVIGAESPLTDIAEPFPPTSNNLEDGDASGSYELTNYDSRGVQLANGLKVFSGQYDVVNANGHVTFSNDIVSITDGTKDGTKPIGGFFSGSAAKYNTDPFDSVTGIGGKFFALSDGRAIFIGNERFADFSYGETQLFVTNGSTVSAISSEVKNVSDVTQFANGQNLFLGNTQSGGILAGAIETRGLWVTDGNSVQKVSCNLHGYSLIKKDLGSGKWLFSLTRDFVDSDGDGWEEPVEELWVTDGTADGTRLVMTRFESQHLKDVMPLGGNKAIITYYESDGGTSLEPWVIDLAGGGATLLSDILPGQTSSNPLYLTQMIPQGDIPIPVSTLFPVRVSLEEEVSSFDLDDYFTDPEGSTLTFDVRGLPADITLDKATKVISTTPTVAEGVHQITVVASNPQGGTVASTFDWTVVDTGQLKIATTGDWLQAEAGGPIVSTFGSVVTIGRKDGTEKLFSVEGGTPTNPVVKIDKGKITIDGEIFSEQFDARLGGTERAVMEGNFTVDMATLAVSGFKDDKVTDDYRLMGGLIDMTFADIVIDKNQINFRTDIAFDASLGDIPTLGALSTTNAPLSVTFSDAGVGFGASAGGRWLPEPVTLDLGGSGLSLGFSDIGIEYDSASDSIYLSGKASFGWGGEIANQFDFVGNDSERSLVIDLAGTVQTDNYFQRGDKYFHLYKGSAPLDLDWDVIGSVTYQDKYEGEIPSNGFLVKELKIDLNTVTDILSGGFTATIPWAFDKRDISATLGLKYAPTWQLDSIGFGIDGLNAPLGTTGIFVQGGKLALEDLANADPKAPAIYKAEISGTWGPNSSALPSPIRGKITGQVKFPELEAGIQLDSKVGYFVPTIVNKYAEPLIEYFGVNPSAVTNYVLFDLAATAKTDLSADSYSLSGSFKSLNNAFVGTATLKAFADYEVDIEKGFDGKGDMNFEASVTGLFTVPTAFPLIGGRSRGGSGLVKYSADDDYSNDTISAWTQITIPLGFTTKVYGAGVRFALDGEWELLGRNTIPKLSSWALQDTTDLVILSAEWQIASDNVAIELIAPDGLILSEADIAARSDIALVADLNSDTSRHVALEFPQTGIWDLRVVNPSGLGGVSYYASDMLESAVAEFVSVTPDTDAHGAAISLSTDSGDAGAGRVVIFAGDQTGLTGGVEIASYDLQDGIGSLSHDLDYSQLGPGTWYLYTRTEADGVVPVVRMFDEPLVITGAADLGVTIRQINFGPTGTPVLVIEVTNTGDRPSDPGAVFIEVPEAMIGATPVEETGAGPLSAAQTVLTLPALAPGASMEWRYALAPGTEDLADAISVEAVAAGIDANPQDNRSDFVLHENDLREVDQFKIADEYGDTVIGDGGNDTLVGSDYNDLFFGGGGSDDVDGRGGGSDLMGFDFYDGFVASNGLSIDLSTGIVHNDGTGATDTIFLVEDILGTRHDDLILGDGSSNYLAGLAGNDTISGFDATDLMWGGDGLDVLDGGAGSDMLLFITAGTRFDYDGIPFGFFGIPLGTHGVQVNLATGAVLDEFGFQETVTGFENVSGTGYADSLIGDGIRNVLFGDDGADYIDGAGGNDRLEGGGGNDTLIGGDGFDHAAYYNAFSSVVVNLATGQATDDGDGGTDTLSGIEGLFGSEYSDVLIGDDVGNEIIGLGGDDTIDGGGGWDNVYYGNAPFWVVVDLATGEVSGGDGNDRLTSIEWVFGSDYSDALLGDDLDNDLRGLWGDDELFGRGGNDTLVGGAGDDTIDGGAGIDTVGYSGNQTSYTLTLGPGGTTLTDRRDGIEGTDQLSNVELLDFGTDLFGSAFDLTKFGGLSGLSPEDFQSFIEMYIAYFNRAPDAVGLFFWGTAFGNGTSLDEMATLFIDQDETRAAYPAGTSNEDFAATVYENVLGRLPDAAGFDFWVGLLDDQSVGRDAFILEVLRGAKAAPPQDATAEFIQQQLADQAYLGTKTDLGAYFAVHKGMSDVANASAAMGLFDGSASSVTMARSAIDGYYADALDPENGEFLMQLVGVLDDPF